MKINRKIGLKSFLTVIFSCSILIFPGTALNHTICKAKTVTDYEDGILKVFTENSTEYKQIKLEMQKYLNTQSEYQHTLDRYNERMSRAGGDPETLKDLTMEYENCLLQQNINNYYVKYGEQWLDEKLRNLKYKFLSEYLQLPVIKSKLDYNNAVLKEMKDTLKIAQVLYRSGYAKKLDVDNIETQINNIKANIQAIEGEYSYLQYKIEKQLNVTKPDTFFLDRINSILTQEKYEQKYLSSNSTWQYLQTQIEAYKTYKANLQTKGNSYESDVNKSDIELQLLDLKQQRYKSDVSQNIKKLCSAFQSQTALLDSKDKEISNTESKLKVMLKLYKKGKVKKIEITKLKTELVKRKYEKENLLYEQNVAYFGLFYYIELNSN